MNYIKELAIEHDISIEEAEELLRDMADELCDRAKYGELE